MLLGLRDNWMIKFLFQTISRIVWEFWVWDDSPHVLIFDLVFSPPPIPFFYQIYFYFLFLFINPKYYEFLEKGLNHFLKTRTNIDIPTKVAVQYIQRSAQIPDSKAGAKTIELFRIRVPFFFNQKIRKLVILNLMYL